MNNRIFIIEDDYNLLSGLTAKFSVYGFEATPHNGSGSVKDLVNNIITSSPGYLILDLILPDFDGFEVLKKLKNDPYLNNIPVFVYSNLADKASRQQGESHGADFYFVKSEISTDEFVDKVVKIIKNRDKLPK